MAEIHIGAAGWSIPLVHRTAFPASGSLLARYAGRLDAVEINSSFYRPHRRSTYERWADSVPPTFRFSVKVPRAMTHERRLADCDALAGAFADGVAGLGETCGPLLVQLPPSLVFDAVTMVRFLVAMRARTASQLVCEPRHPSWFAADAEALLAEHGVARVAADPALAPGAGEPGGWRGLAYYRWHGAPRTYYSDYGPQALADVRRRLEKSAASADSVWCVFDNTALGHALGNALTVAADASALPR